MRTNKIVTAITAVIMAGVLAAGVCCLGFASRGNDGKWFGNFKDISGWHWSDKVDGDITDKPDTPDNPENPDNSDKDIFKGSGDYTEVVETGNKGLRLMSARIAPADYAEYGISPQSQDAYTITATVKDANGGTHDYLQDITYSVAWADTNAASLSEYIEYSQDNTTFTFSIKAAFSTPIKITCVSNLEPSVSASATVNYYRRLNGFKSEIFESAAVSSFDEFSLSLTMPDVSLGVSNGTYNNKNLKFITAYDYSIGTKNCSVSMVYMDIVASDNFKAACAGNSYLACNGTLSLRGSTVYSSSLVDFFHTIVGNSCLSYSSARYALFCALANTTNQFVISGTVHTNVGQYTFSGTLNVTASAAGPSSITFDKTNFDI